MSSGDKIRSLYVEWTLKDNYTTQAAKVNALVAGRAQLSRSGRAVNVRIEGKMMTAPFREVRAMVEGQRTAARLSSPALDTDRAQRGSDRRRAGPGILSRAGVRVEDRVTATLRGRWPAGDAVIEVRTPFLRRVKRI